jgi:hypothetical protein
MIPRMQPLTRLMYISGGFPWFSYSNTARTDWTPPDVTAGGYTQVYRNAHAWTATKPDGTITCWGLDLYGVSGCPTAPWKPVAYVFSANTRFCYRKCTSLPCTLSCHVAPDCGQSAGTVHPESAPASSHVSHGHSYPSILPRCIPLLFQCMWTRRSTALWGRMGGQTALVG